jgi:FkbM family methyltransferase
MKTILKQWLKKLPIAFTQNQRYDRQTKAIIRRVCKADSTCIDVGCHKGEVLDVMLQAAPQGIHYGFEPIPVLYQALRKKYQEQKNCTILDLALSNEAGEATFNYVVSNPSYSGLRKRKYDRADEQDTSITVRTARLDEVLPAEQTVDLIKIDVEGGEMLVLEGAQQTLLQKRPIVLFEHGLGASDYYGAGPEQVYAYFESCQYKIYTLKGWLKGEKALKSQDFSEQFFQRVNYFFVACPGQGRN